jgi:hypothetical protein
MVLAAAIAVVFVPVAEAGKARTTVTLDNIEVTPGETLWTGDIFSPRKACKNRRRVFVYRVRAGADEKRGSTLSYKGKAQPGYFWVYEEEGIPPTGGYYAKVKPTARCKGDRSPTLSLGVVS